MLIRDEQGKMPQRYEVDLPAQQPPFSCHIFGGEHQTTFWLLEIRADFFFKIKDESQKWDFCTPEVYELGK